MEPADVSSAMAATTAIANGLGLATTGATVLHNSNKLALRLSPCDVFARIAHVGREVARFEVELAQRLGKAGCPVAALEPRVPPVVHQRDGFVVTLWTFYEHANGSTVPAAEYSDALARLHAGMREVDLASPHFTDRVAEAQHVVANPDLSPDLSDADRNLLAVTLSDLRQATTGPGRPEQLLHGEPHPGNVLMTAAGPRFIDLETCCRGPIELDLAYAPTDVSDQYPDVDRELLDTCRGFMLAMVAAWRFEASDQFPNGRQARQKLLRAVRQGPPWPTLDHAMRATD